MNPCFLTRTTYPGPQTDTFTYDDSDQMLTATAPSDSYRMPLALPVILKLIPPPPRKRMIVP